MALRQQRGPLPWAATARPNGADQSSPRPRLRSIATWRAVAFALLIILASIVVGAAIPFLLPSP